MKPETNLCITQGDEKAYNLSFKTGADALDITGATVKMTVKRSRSDVTPILEKTVAEHTDPTNGKTTITLSTTDTDRPLGIYYYDVQISGGSIAKKTILKGTLDITWQVTED